MEEWRSIPRYEGVYEISNLGRLKALKRTWYSGEYNNIRKEKEEHILKTHYNMGGYECVTLNSNGQKKELVHRLLAAAFIDNPDNKPFVNHLDGNKRNNDLSNLEWCTEAENTQHAYYIGLQVSKKRGDHSRAKGIKCSTLNMDFKCIRDAAEILGITESIISNICRGGQNHTEGLTFRYI